VDKKRLEQYMLALRGGDTDALDGIYGLTSRGVYLLAYSVLRGKQRAEDVMQNTYIRLAANIGQYKPDTNASAWILQIARSLCYREYAAGKRKAVGTENVRETGENAEELWIDNILLRGAFRRLSPEEREIAALYAAGHKHREIAVILNKPAGTVRWLYREAVDKMRRYMDGNAETGSTENENEK
jgi:RNA polymerase sigma-70 factor (ECF subfamily)